VKIPRKLISQGLTYLEMMAMQEDSLAWKVFIGLNFDSYAAPEDHLLVRQRSPFFGGSGAEGAGGKARPGFWRSRWPTPSSCVRIVWAASPRDGNGACSTNTAGVTP
jgi:hypothetical protein